MVFQIDVCPKCHKQPEKWYEQMKHNSRELYWIGCRSDGILAGGISQGVAVTNWNRQAQRNKFAMGGV